jgi:hypothetical protein
MPLVSVSAARRRAKLEESRRNKTARTLLRESATYQLSLADRTFDIFLSHSYADKQLILGVKLFLQDAGFSVYVDWIEDKKLDRTQVDKQTARTLRRRMDKCRSLLYAHTVNSSRSVWMPWELGYFDGRRGRVAVFPLSKSSAPSGVFKGREYLGIYPYILRKRAGNRLDYLVFEPPGTFTPLGNWIGGGTRQIH